jgi:hypothetical protein
MKEIFDKIVEETEQCSKEKESFILPSFPDCNINEEDYSSGGATLYGKRYEISNEQGKIIVTYESKDKCKTFQVNPDMNIVTVKHYDSAGNIVSNYSQSWEDKF